MNFISNKSLNNGTFSRFKCFLTPYKTKDMKIKNFPLRNCQKNRLSHMTRGACLYLPKHTIRSQWACLVWRVKMNFISNKSLNHGTISRFKCFHTPCRTRDSKRKIQNFPSRNLQKKRIGHHTWHVCCLYYNSLAKSESRLQLQLMHSIVLLRLCFT